MHGSNSQLQDNPNGFAQGATSIVGILHLFMMIKSHADCQDPNGVMGNRMSNEILGE